MFIGHDHSLFGIEKSYIKVMGRMLVSKINAVGLTSIDSSFFLVLSIKFLTVQQVLDNFRYFTISLAAKSKK